MSPLQPFVHLKDPSTYVACDWDLTEDAFGRRHWVDFFCQHAQTLLGLGVTAAVARGESEAAAQGRAAACLAEFAPRFRAFDENPHAHGRVTILVLDQWRDDLLRKHGFVDAMIDLKDRENEKMLPLLPTVCGEIDRHPCGEQLITLVRGVFAGNLFDMGAGASAKLFKDGKGPSFFETRESIKPRPWLIDQFDAFKKRVMSEVYRKCVFFIDNAGSDFLLGAVPMMRWFAQGGMEVVIAANERPTLNDMTVHDVRRWWPRILQAETSLRDLPISIVSTGTGEPLIDLSGVSPELNAASIGADLIIIEGMGRGVESNLNAEFTVDAVNLAMIKDESIARRNNGTLFDCVCRFR
jgi:damage-control phosphatase, subfamily II, stand-alone protein